MHDPERASMQQPSMVSAFLFLPQLPSMTYGPDEIKINHFLLSVALVRVVYHSNIMKWSSPYFGEKRTGEPCEISIEWPYRLLL